MTNTPGSGYEDYLADCTTNVFSLADTSGLKWKRFASACKNSDSTINDPVLNAFSIARANDVLCVWKRVTQPGLSLDDSSPLFDYPKELVIFWYGEEPALQDFPGPYLQEIEFGSSDDGISSENLDIFFKAIHNVIERNLLSENFVRLGNWFTSPLKTDDSSTLSTALAFSFSIFIHGISSVVASVNIKQKGTVRVLTKKDLQKASLQIGNFDSKVLLAPFGLNAQLTGHSIPDSDSRTIKIMNEWRRFFPVESIKKENKENSQLPSSHSAKTDYLPMMVEVMLGDTKMLYPSALVLVSQPQTGKAMKLVEKPLPVNPTQIVNHIWKRLKKKEEPSSPKKQLWDFKDPPMPTGCKCCSNTNVSRVKSSMPGANPFNASYLYATNSSQAKAKKEPAFCPQTNFHQRPIKIEKAQGRLTPLLTGRVTPSLNNSYKTPQSNHERPASVGSNNASKNVEQQKQQQQNPAMSVVKVEEKTVDELATTAASSLLPLSQIDKTSNSFLWKKVKEQSIKAIYSIPKSFKFSRPTLETGVLEIRTSVIPLENLMVKNEEELLSPNSVFHDHEPPLMINDLALSITTSDEANKVIEKPTVPVKRGPGRPKGRRNSNLSTTMSPMNNIDDELLSPNTRRQSTRQMLRGRKRESPIESPRADSPPPGPARPKKSRKSTRGGDKTPNTVKSEPVFTFGNTSVKPVSSITSPATPFFSPTVKASSNSLTSQKDIEVSEADLMHLFDDEEEEESITKIISSNTSVLSPYSMDDNITSIAPMITTTALTSHDLAKMFPTPPSIEESVMHQTMSPSNTDNHMTYVHSTMLLSPADSGRGNSSEDFYNLRSPAMDIYPTFELPKIEVLPMPDDFKPVKLPSEKLSPINGKQMKYVPSWDKSQTPPLLSRRPSNNQSSQVSLTSTLNATSSRHSSTFDSKLSLPLVSPALSQQTFSDTSTPSLSVLPQDHQSLVLNLRLTDSFLNWINKNVGCDSFSTATSIQDKTFKIFSIYQNLVWKNATLNNNKSQNWLFPKDDPIEKCLDIIKEQDTDFQPSRFPLSTDLIEILLKQFSSTFSIKYFHMLLSQYYAQNLEKVKENDGDKMGLQQKKLLCNMKSLLDSAMQKPLKKSVFNQPKIEGPLPLSDLNNKQNVLTSTPSSTHGLLFSYDNETVSVSPEAVKHWQRLYLEPFGGQRKVEYIVVLPDADIVVNGMKLLFKELNSLYESLHLGTHTPIVKDLRDGFLRINQKNVSQVASTTVDSWFDQSDSNVMSKMKVVAQFCKRNLGSYLASIVDTDRNSNKRFSSTISPSTPNSNQAFSRNSSTSLTVSLDENESRGEREHQSFFVLYMVDPFNAECKLNNYPAIWSYIGLMKCLLEMKNDLNDYLKENLVFEIIPLEQILRLTNKTGQLGGPFNPELKELALSVYSKCRPNSLAYMNKIKCMTGFGIGQLRENLVRRRKAENNLPTTIYMPPYVLSPSPKYLNHELKYVNKAKEVFTSEKNVNTLFCCYCLSADKQWMFVSCTDQFGELSETTMIKICYPKKKKNKALIWSVSLQKLWFFLTSVLSFSICSWRVVLAKYGDVGFHELKELKAIIQKNSEISIPDGKSGRPMSPLSENCGSCSKNCAKKGGGLFKSISFCTIKKDTRINFIKTRRIQATNVVNCRIYVMPSYKNVINITPQMNGGMGASSMFPGMMGGIQSQSDLLGTDPASLLNNAFEEDNEANFIPMLSSPGDTLFQSSPQPELSKILSPQNPNNSIASLSPFQPIQNKQQVMTTPVKNYSGQEQYLGDGLCEGYLVAVFSKNHSTSSSATLPETDERNTEIIKSDLFIHCASGETKPFQVPLDSNDHLEVLRSILESFEVLSWLNINASTGKRLSPYPIHVSTVLTCKDILDKLSDG